MPAERTADQRDDLSEELWESLATMESRITVLESQVAEIAAATTHKRDRALLKDAVIAGDEAYVCMRYARGEPCTYEHRVRRIGFDRCFDESCPWVLKLE